MEIFQSQPGSVIALDSPGIPMNLFVSGWGGYPLFKSILTTFAVTTKSGIQYMHTLRDMVYAYIFGERLAPIQIGGVSFTAQCEQLANQLVPSNHGLEYALAYYINNRVSSRGLPVTMVLGLSTPFFGFLDGGTFSIADTERLLGNFSFNFTAIPQIGVLDRVA